MLRTLLLTSVVSLGLLSPLTSQADAREFHHEHRHEHDCRVFYRDPCRTRWEFGGAFHNHREAERFAESYRCRGFEVSIR